MNTSDREDYRSENGLAAFWQKDGAWHIALPDQFKNGELYWTGVPYPSKEAAIKAIEG